MSIFKERKTQLDAKIPEKSDTQAEL